MAKKVEVEVLDVLVDGLDLDNSVMESKPVDVKKPVSKAVKHEELEDVGYVDEPTVSCLRNEKVSVKYIPKESGMVSNPKHVFYGGLAESSVRIFTVPILESNALYVNVLTNSEKSFLEEFMGLPHNALSIYKRTDNFWDNYQVRLTKGETILDLSNPDDYIKYKVLLANRDYIAPSLETLLDTPKATYQFVIISKAEEAKNSKVKINSTMEAYKEFGKYENDYDTLRLVVEILSARPTSSNTKLEFLQTQANELILADSKLFVNTIQDPLLSTKVLIRKAIEEGIVSKRGDYYYLKDGNVPLCENNENPTLSTAARFLNTPKRQEIKFMIEAKLNK